MSAVLHEKTTARETENDGNGAAISEPLWFDDHVGNFSEIVRHLNTFGLHPKSYETSPQNLDAQTILKHKLIISDNRFDTENTEDSQEGTAWARDFIRKEDGIRIILFSAFIDASRRRQYVEQDSSTGSAIFYVPKLAAGADDKESYVKGLAECFHEFFTLDFEKLDQLRPPSNYFESPENAVGYAEFENLPVKEKARLYREFEVIAHDRIENLFERGAIWIFFAGSAEEEYQVAYETSDILSSDEVRVMCQRLDAIPYIFRKDVRVESTGCVNKRNSRGSPDALEFYPVATVIFDAAEIAGKEVSFHYDTGADYNLISNDFLEESKIPKHSIVTKGHVYWDSKAHYVDEVEVDVVSVNPDTGPEPGGRYSARVKALAVDSWDGSKFIIRCDSVCESRDDRQGICKHRQHGLLGRTLSSKRGLDLVISSRTSRVSLVTPEDDEN